ncbi:MAG: phosphoribosylamine--glycine ligase [Bryobacteraceae bacterium]|nr:phosphoribosylamine--glycine ligase [Bryobacteraceae bacterium]
MKVLVIGGGGREHALAWRLARGASITRVYVTPGNPGMANVAECVPLENATPEEYLGLAERLGVDFTVVGPEAPLVAGVVDLFRQCGKPIVGPTKAAANLEGSKVFSKEIMNSAGIPTARYTIAESEAEALAALPRFELPVVLKADGLAAGKGVIVAKTRDEASDGVRALFSGQLAGDAGRVVVIEDFLPGREVSFIVLTDGETVVPLAPTQDHKAVHDGDEGPNTGGMGAFCADNILTGAETQEVLDRVIAPTIRAMAQRGTPFSGFLYAGLMMTEKGIQVLEFNARLGDPECQTLMHRMNSDWGAVLYRAATGRLAGVTIGWDAAPSVCVVAAAHGYPGQVRTGDSISGVRDAEAGGAVVFQAGTRLNAQGGLVTAGGRVLGVTASGVDLRAAMNRAYLGMEQIRFEGIHFRRDIGAKGLARRPV